MKKNENKTHKFLKQILKDVPITHPFYIKEKIYDEDNKIVRNYILVDFYFKIGSTEFLVEYNGSQHHRVVKKWGGVETLRKQKIRDSWLREYCAKNGFVLIEIDGRKIRGKKINAYLKRRLKTLGIK